MVAGRIVNAVLLPESSGDSVVTREVISPLAEGGLLAAPFASRFGVRASFGGDLPFSSQGAEFWAYDVKPEPLHSEPLTP